MEPRRFPSSQCGLCPLCKPVWLGQGHDGQTVAEGLESLEPMPRSCAVCSQKVVVVLQSLSHVRFFATPWTAARQDSLSFTVSQNLLKLMSIDSVMPSNCLILCLISLQSKRLSRIFYHSSKASILWCSAFIMVQLPHPYMTTEKTIALTIQTFVIMGLSP